MATGNVASKTVMQRFLDTVEKVGNMVPHPVVIFLILIAIVIGLSAVLGAFGAAVTFERINPDTHKVETATTAIRSLLNVEGIRFIYSSLIPNFMSFTAVGLMIVAMIGAGVAEESGLVTALIRKLVIVSPRWALTYILSFVGILASIAADAGYLVLIPLAGIAYLAVGRHPLAGLALGFAAVAGAFTVNMLIKPLDAVLVEFTNDAAHLVDPNRSIGLASNVWFSIASVLFLTVIIAFISDRMIEPRLGKYDPKLAAEGTTTEQGATLSEQESRGLRFAGFGLLGLIVVFCLLTIPAGAPLRNPTTGELIGNSPFMNGLIALIMLMFLTTGWTYGIGAGTLRTLTEVIAAIEKSIKNLGGTIFLFFVLSQFVAYFTYTNMGTVMALSLSGVLQSANIGALPLAARLHRRCRDHRPAADRRNRQMGDLRARLRPAADEARRRTGGRARRLSRGRLPDERDHPAQRLFRARRRLRPEIRQDRRRRHDRLADAALCHVDVRALDRALRSLEMAWIAGACDPGRSLGSVTPVTALAAVAPVQLPKNPATLN
jgi:aminobenzoyl-glutamate transport protein